MSPNPNKVAGPSLAKNDGMVAPRNGSIRSIEAANVKRRKPRSRFAIRSPLGSEHSAAFSSWTQLSWRPGRGTAVGCIRVIWSKGSTTAPEVYRGARSIEIPWIRALPSPPHCYTHDRDRLRCLLRCQRGLPGSHNHDVHLEADKLRGLLVVEFRLAVSVSVFNRDVLALV